MAATVEIHGQTATVEGDQWSGDEPLASQLQHWTETEFQHGYYPDYARAVAESAIAHFGGRLLRADPLPEGKPGVVY